MNQEEKIELYVMDRMSKEDRISFEKEISSDKNLKAKVDAHKEFALSVETFELKQKLENFSYDSESKDATSFEKPNSKRWIAVGIIMGVILLSLYFLQGDDPYIVEDANDFQIANVFYPDPGLPTPMSSTNQYDFYDAMVDYKSEDYQAAFDKFSSIENGSTNDTINFYRAMSLLNLNKFEDAQVILHELSNGGPFDEKVKWYKSYNHLELNESEKAIDILQTIEPNTFEGQSQLIEYLTKD